MNAKVFCHAALAASVLVSSFSMGAGAFYYGGNNQFSKSSSWHLDEGFA